MSQALQVNFRRLTPCEQLVLLAKQRFEKLATHLPHASECLVSLEQHEARSGGITDAHVRIGGRGHRHHEAHAADRDPARALALALTRLEAALVAELALWN